MQCLLTAIGRRKPFVLEVVIIAYIFLEAQVKFLHVLGPVSLSVERYLAHIFVEFFAQILNDVVKWNIIIPFLPGINILIFL
jgi:hypothetical protein